MHARFAQYLRSHGDVQGWLSDETLVLTAVLDAFQATHSVSGSIAEIGVHHGKYFIGLALLRRDAERALALDVFEDQEANVDESGKGDREIFVANVERHVGGLDAVEVVKADSLKTTPEDILGHAGAPVRLFSVDGGHTAVHAKNDLHLAEATLADGGVVSLDDFFHYYWPGVTLGTFEYLAETRGEGLEPFCLANNKLYLAKPEWSRRYLELVQTIPGTEGRAIRDFAGHDAAVLNTRPLSFALKAETPAAVARTAREWAETNPEVGIGVVESGLAYLDPSDADEILSAFRDLSLRYGNAERATTFLRWLVAERPGVGAFEGLLSEVQAHASGS